jgi:hypothetical protein
MPETGPETAQAEAPTPASAPDPTVAWSKVQGYLDKLFDALEELEEGGGVVEAARRGGWKPAKLDKAAGSLNATREAIQGELARLKAARREQVRR